MAPTPATVEDSSGIAAQQRAIDPGIVVIFGGGQPVMRPIPLEGNHVVLGREHAEPLLQADDRLSRRHAEIQFESGVWTIRDLQSRNGTHVNGRPVTGSVAQPEPRVVRIGRTVFLVTTHLQRFLDEPKPAKLMAADGVVTGPTMREARALITQAASSDTVLITGESGTGKELAARAFHAAGPYASGAFVPVNCAAIPEGVAERLLFGAKRGAYSGSVADVGGYVQAAEGGVLFLDEIGELELDVQAKLLRLLESREVLQLGASVARKVRVAICLATHRDLRADVAAGRFRADLFYRIADTHVRLPALRDRPEEVPWLIAREVDRIGGLELDARLIEACLLRPWPGNVREILGAVRRACQAALGAKDTVVTAEHLEAAAGNPMTPADADAGRISQQPDVTREAIETELRASDGNISAAARALGVHRTQLYRLMKRFGLEGASEK